MKKNKTVMVFGTFDFFHIGHLHLLSHAKKLGNRLVVVIAPDAIVKKLKGKASIHTEKERMSLIAALSLVDIVIFGDKKMSVYGVIERARPDVIALGYDQKALKKDLDSFLKHHSELSIITVTLPAYKPSHTKSSRIKRALHV